MTTGAGHGRAATMRQAHTITVDDGHAGRRLDKFLRSRFKGVPAGLIFRHIRQGRLRVNGCKTAQDYRLVAGDEISVPALHVDDRRADTGPVPTALIDRMRRTVLYEDDRLLVVDKPAGVAVHRGSNVPAGVIEALRVLRPDAPDLELVHRLDRDSSGVLALAKDPALLRELQTLLRARESSIERHYLAVVAGRFPAGSTVLDAPLRRTERRVVVDARGERAETRVRVRRSLGAHATVVAAELVTGRKHQIRVHLADAGHPILGDDRYGDPDRDRAAEAGVEAGLHLHARRLVIPRSGAGPLTVTAPVPRRWRAVLGPAGRV